MTDAPPPQSGGFVEGIRAAADREVNAILADARGRTAEVERVLTALGLPLPEGLKVLHQITAGVSVPSQPTRESIFPPAAEVEAEAERTGVEAERAERAELPEPPPPPPRHETSVAKAARERDELETAIRDAMRRHEGEDIRVPDILGEVNIAASGVVRPPQVKEMLEYLAKIEWLTKKGSVGDQSYSYRGDKEKAPSPPPPPPSPPARRPPSIPGARRGARPTTGERPPTTPRPPTTSASTGERPGRKAPTHPGVEGVPEHLRFLPAAQGSGPLKARIGAAQDQLRVLKDFLDNPGSISPEVADRTQLPYSRVGKYAKDLRESKPPLIEQSGKARIRIGARQGKPGTPYSVTAKARQELGEGEAEPSGPLPATPVGEASPPPSRQDLINLVREALRKHAGEQVAAPDVQSEMNRASPGLHISLDTTEHLLNMLVDSGALQAFNDGALRRYRYDRPTDPGAGARADARRQRTGRDVGADPVAGTGRGIRSPSSEVNAVLAAARKVLGMDNVERTQKNHWMIRLPGGGNVLIGGNRIDEKDKGRLRVAGVPV